MVAKRGRGGGGGGGRGRGWGTQRARRRPLRTSTWIWGGGTPVNSLPLFFFPLSSGRPPGSRLLTAEEAFVMEILWIKFNRRTIQNLVFHVFHPQPPPPTRALSPNPDNWSHWTLACLGEGTFRSPDLTQTLRFVSDWWMNYPSVVIRQIEYKLQNQKWII